MRRLDQSYERAPPDPGIKPGGIRERALLALGIDPPRRFEAEPWEEPA